jgi:GTP-binding protein EngB required for normal cell division
MKFKFELPRGNFPRLCLLGNSNVGKSSLTKLLLSHPQLYKGKVGKTPGSTVRLTIINDPALKYHIIDLPGFGVMKRQGKDIAGDVQDQILQYLELDRANIFLLLLVVSADRIEDELEKWFYRNNETIPLTVEFLQYAIEQEIPVALVLNKIDKVFPADLDRIRTKLKEVLQHFEISVADPESSSSIAGIWEVSVKTGSGIVDLKNFIGRCAAALDLSQFDPRDEFKKLPVIGTTTPPKKSSLPSLGHKKKPKPKKSHR